jgi:hypothetical protein
LLQLSQTQLTSGDYAEAIQRFVDIVQEEQFRRRYFSQVSASTLAVGIGQASLDPNPFL